MRSIPSINRLAHLRPQAALIILAALALTVSASVKQSLFNLTYYKPASKWTEALPLGNGRIGAMVFGGTEDERLQINESTLWGGVPHGTPTQMPTVNSGRFGG
jgi:alpha-L-fucosidase 2